jgi:hypothetical protein
VSAKKAKGKGEGTTKEPAKPEKKEAAAKKKGKDLVEVRENITELVMESAVAIANKVIEAAKTGQLTSARYLFEAAGIYPVTEQTAIRPIETSLAHTLLTRMGLPLDPVICSEEPVPALWKSDAKSATETARLTVVEEVPEGERAEDAGPVLVENEE